MKVSYYLVFSIAKENTRYAGGHANHHSFSDRSDAERHAAALAAQDGDSDYQVCEFVVDVPESMMSMLTPAD